jgi:hypothetical protein
VTAEETVTAGETVAADEPGPRGARRQFAPGTSIVRRNTGHGRVWSVAPLRVVSDATDVLVAACWPGIRMLAPVSYIESVRSGQADDRRKLVQELADGTWQLGERTWQHSSYLAWISTGDYFSVHRFFRPDGKPGVWYVNFELPARRTAIGYDTCDLCVDLVVEPDLASYQWKDEDEYEIGRETGFISDAVHDQVELARKRLLALLAERAGPFAGDWSEGPHDPAWPLPPWPLPSWPADALIVPVAGRPG